MKILVIGDMAFGTNSRSLAEGFAKVGHEVRSIDISRSTSPRRGSALWFSLRGKDQVTHAENFRVRNEVSAAVSSFSPDVLVAIKTVNYDQSIFFDNRVPIRLHLSYDDVSNVDNISSRYLDRERDWDSIITTKRHNVSELLARGAKDVLFIWGAYDPEYQRSIVPLRQRRYEVGFIGAARSDRCDLPRGFAANVPGKGVIYGPRWRRHYPLGLREVALRAAATGNAYTVASNSFRIGLILLNSENRDQHTMRSFETPAAGQMILAQRTDEHSELFEEDKHAIFFEDMDEAWEKVGFLLQHDDLVAKIAEAGHQLILSGQHTYRDRAEQILAHVSS